MCGGHAGAAGGALMTEQQAWRKMAQTFEAFGFHGWGLCRELTYHDGLSDAVRERMMDRIAVAVKRHPWARQTAYAWPLTAEGARARARFCRRQVARLTRERRR